MNNLDTANSEVSIQELQVTSAFELLSMPPKQIHLELKNNKALKITGTTITFDEFILFSKELLSSFGVDPSSYGNRPTLTDDESTYEAVKGTDLVLPHGELYSLPSPPDYLFLYCNQPASTGGHTTIYSGKKINHFLDKDVFHQFKDSSIVYTHKWSRFQWEPFFKTKEISVAKQKLEEMNGISISKIVDALVEFSFETSAFSDLGDGAFVNGIVNILSRKHQGINHVTWENGREIDGSILNQINSATERCEISVNWKAGEILVIDNHRVMHGRKAFTGERKLAVRFGKKS